MSNGHSNSASPLKCSLCGGNRVSVRCDGCNDVFCDSCDEANHKHPKRRSHHRRRLLENGGTQVKPPLPPKNDPGAPPPVPPPRRNRRNQVGCVFLWLAFLVLSRLNDYFYYCNHLFHHHYYCYTFEALFYAWNKQLFFIFILILKTGSRSKMFPFLWWRTISV